MTANRQSSVSAEYARWWKRLSPDERKALVDSGAFRADDPADATPLDSRASVNAQHFDFMRAEEEKSYSDPTREMSMKIQSPSAVSDVMDAEDILLSSPRVAALDLAGLRLRATLHFLLDGLDDSTDPAMRLHADIIRIVVGEGKPPRMTDLAKTHHISKAAVSLRCRKLLRRLGLEPSRFMRSEKHVTSMKFSRIMSHITGKHVSVGGRRRPASLDLDTPGKESLEKPSKPATRSRPRKKEAKNLSFPKGSGKAGQPRKNKRK